MLLWPLEWGCRDPGGWPALSGDPAALAVRRQRRPRVDRPPTRGYHGPRVLMVNIKTKSRVNADGSLVLPLATGLPESEVDVLVVVDPVPAPPVASGHGGWLPASLEALYGCLADDPLERLEQGE